MFLIDTSLKASGEGTCKPSPDVCSFLYLKLDKQSDTEDLLAENPDGTGIEYTLKLLDIKKVPVSELANASKSAEVEQARRDRGPPPARQARHAVPLACSSCRSCLTKSTASAVSGPNRSLRSRVSSPTWRCGSQPPASRTAPV